MPAWSSRRAGHCRSDSQEERSVRCWSSTTLAKKHQATSATSTTGRVQSPGDRRNDQYRPNTKHQATGATEQGSRDPDEYSPHQPEPKLVELLAAAVGAFSVWLSVRQNIWSWPTAIVNVVLYAIVFYQTKLYADMGLQVVYAVLSLYGWYEWLYGGEGRTELRVTRTGRRLGTLLTLIAAAGSAALGVLLHRTTDAALPFMDSFLSSTSLVAQWMMTRKLLENWLVWIGVDVLYVGMFVFKGLYLTAGLYAVFLALAVNGYLDWRRSMADAAAAEATA
jgi:nicotinamide mononucleotide transporter